MTISEADSFYRRNLEWVENVKSVNQSRAEQSFQEVMVLDLELLINFQETKREWKVQICPFPEKERLKQFTFKHFR
jgi:hypothetical protein